MARVALLVPSEKDCIGVIDVPQKISREDYSRIFGKNFGPVSNEIPAGTYTKAELIEKFQILYFGHVLDKT